MATSLISGGSFSASSPTDRVVSASPVNALIKDSTARSDSDKADSICASHKSSMCAICCSGVHLSAAPSWDSIGWACMFSSGKVGLLQHACDRVEQLLGVE